ncbi:prolipoprotein diacylglyceryl transferase [Stackebrandtia albiflava]|uniref:Phosphatidylglycerol--prolipoprotein diacylglyceryl transferase n=1 Tax=Stackebrandtia albiflava TaxID=406432 RepID=A0A562VEG2_9ACTN|nr:prolipoprotein diacylglyceryl transferase [Stackebrandtia albiflava]TWJ16207.1 prolipoprotein diacylglyceryl transferase [Stackebrandtia albiflava]
MDLAYIPSPPESVWYLFGLVPLRAYAMCIIAGIVAACVITEYRLRRRGAPSGTVIDLAVWAVPFGIIGGRIYHVITSPDAYFGVNGDPVKALYIWEGGLGIPGAIVLGGVGVWIACRRHAVSFSMVADAAAPAIPVAQAIGRLGNWFNQELYGRPTDLPWGVQIDREYQIDVIPPEFVGAAAYHPTFLYELLWNLGIALVVWQLDRRFRFGRGRAFAIYVLLYGVGRFWIEGMRIDPAHAFMGLRVNEWMALAMIVGAVMYLLRVSGKQTVLVADSSGALHEVAWDSPEATRDTRPATDEDESADDDETAEGDEPPQADTASKRDSSDSSKS